MQIIWEFSKEDLDAVTTVIQENRNHDTVKNRQKRCSGKERVNIKKEEIWRCLAMAMLTTQARITPDGPLETFRSERPFPISLRNIRENMNRGQAADDYIYSQLKQYNVGTYRQKFAAALGTIFNMFEERKSWRELKQKLMLLSAGADQNVEREVADYICLSKKFPQIGPKQARNFLQDAQLIRYEVPIDSRFTRWLNEQVGFPFKVAPGVLGDTSVYHLVLDGIQALCAKADVFPTVLDAAVFADIGSRGRPGTVVTPVRMSASRRRNGAGSRRIRPRDRL